MFATQPLPRVLRVCEALRARGHEAHALASHAIEPLEAAPLAGAAARLSGYDGVLMVSPTAVAMLAEALGARPWPPQVSAAVVGAGSRDALGEHGLAPARIVMPGGAAAPNLGNAAAGPARSARPPSADADALLAEPELAADALRGQRWLVVRGERGRDDVAATLAARGAQVDVVRAYRRVPVRWPAAAADALASAAFARRPAVFLFTLGETVDATTDALDRAGQATGDWARGCRALAVHPRIAARLADRGWRDVQLIGPGIEALAGALESGPGSGER